MEQQITNIVKQRIRGPIVGIAIVMAVGVFSFGKTDNKLAIIIVASVLVAALSTLSLLNTVNYPARKPWYRAFNKYVYLWGGRLLVVGFVLDTFRTVGEYNPLESTSPSLGETATRAGVDIAGATVASKNIRTAKQVEAYYKAQQTASVAPSTPTVL